MWAGAVEKSAQSHVDFTTEQEGKNVAVPAIITFSWTHFGWSSQWVQNLLYPLETQFKLNFTRYKPPYQISSKFKRQKLKVLLLVSFGWSVWSLVSQILAAVIPNLFYIQEPQDRKPSNSLPTTQTSLPTTQITPACLHSSV